MKTKIAETDTPPPEEEEIGIYRRSVSASELKTLGRLQLSVQKKEPKLSFVETGKVELNVKVPNLLPENAKIVIREVRHGLENCGRLDLLDEFTEVLMVEYREEAN